VSAGATGNPSPRDAAADSSRASHPEAVASQIGNVLQLRDEHMAVAESLTGGQLVACLAQGDEASTWLRGGVVAYQPEVKRAVLGVQPGPVVTEQTAIQMAAGVAELLAADLSIAVTGVGGPQAEEGLTPGTVWLAVRYQGVTSTRVLHLDGDPAAICDQTCTRALVLAHEVLAALKTAR
jgi:nicotinamide-nucleotide amidase